MISLETMLSMAIIAPNFYDPISKHEFHTRNET